jgi:apolipoprotein N-acyltransferase
MLAACVVALILGTGARRFVPLTVAGAIGLMAFVLDGRTWTAAGDQEIPVALIQGAVPQEKKWLPEQLAPTKALYLEQTRKHWDADIVIWPEAAIPAMIDEEFDFLESVDAEAVANGSAVILGMLERGLDDGRYYNSVMTLGAEHGIYRKRHLVPFGEYFPVPAFVRQWMRLMSLPYVDISAGEPAPPPLVVAGQTIGMTICYEDAYGAEQLVFLPEAAVLVNVSNDAWFGDSIAPHQHLQIARMRALETGRYLLRATNTGISAVIGPGGEIRGRSPQFETHVLTGVVRAYSGATPYVRTGNIVVVLLCALLVFASLVRRSK